MNFISCFQINKKAKVHMAGKTINLLTMVVAICKFTAEKISIEKDIGINESIEFVVSCIREGYSTLK